MNATVGQTHARNLEFAHRHLLAVAAGATAVLGLLVAFGAWQAFGGSTASSPAQAVPTIHATTTASEVPMRIYIAADEAQKDRVLRAEQEASMIRFAGGDLTNQELEVIVAADAASQDRLLLDIATANDIRVQQGLTPILVVDLR